MIMKVSENQIEEIYIFTKKCHVEWYEVQTELVDHLANGIEKQWITNPNIPFYNALMDEFKRFGLSGFENLVEEKTKSLNKQYRKQVWFYFKEFFTLPKIILTLFLVWVLFSLMHYLDNKEPLMTVLISVIFAVFIFHFIKFKISIKRRKKKTGKIWLFENTIYGLGGLGVFLNFGFWYRILFDSNRQWTTTSELIVSVIIILYVLITFISVIIIPKRLKEKISKEHPEYSFAKNL